MNFPLKLRFKFFALAPQVYVEDASGAEVCYVKQKLFRLKEKVEVFENSSRSRVICTIQADRMLDFNANYQFRTAEGVTIGGVRRHGMKSLWKAHYEIQDAAGQTVFVIHEENPFVKLIDGVLSGIPVIGLFSGYFFNPSYVISRGTQPVMRMTKNRAFLESRFQLTRLSDVSSVEEMSIVLSLLMFVLLERSRG